MSLEEAKQYCLSLTDVTPAETNNGKWTVLMKNDNVFMLILHSDVFQSIAIHLPVERGQELLDEYNIVSDSILNIKGWYDVDLSYDFPIPEVKEWIKESYNMVSQQPVSDDQDKYVSLSTILGIK